MRRLLLRWRPATSTLLPATLLLLPVILTSCSGQESQQSSRTKADVRSPSVAYAPVSAGPESVTEEEPASPDIAVSAAPDVGFTYRYAFALPAMRIAAVQEEHAQACEKLGLNRCRITGMRYRQVNERRIEAMLAFKLDPTIARQFGKTGIDAVDRAEGELTDSEITGEDAGAAIKAASRGIAQMTDDLRRIEQQLARRGLAAIERDRLQSEAQQLRRAIRASQDTRSEREESLATTPMAFTYDTIAGAPSLGDALKRAWENVLTGTAFLILALITLLPWLGLAALVWVILIMLRPVIARRQEAAFAPEAS
jgi:hypothetical protein